MRLGRLASPEPLDLKRDATRWLMLSIAGFVLCAGVNCLAVIGAVLCFLSLQATDRGLLRDAQTKLKWGKIATLTGCALSLTVIVLAAIAVLRQAG